MMRGVVPLAFLSNVNTSNVRRQKPNVKSSQVKSRPVGGWRQNTSTRRAHLTTTHVKCQVSSVKSENEGTNDRSKTKLRMRPLPHIFVLLSAVPFFCLLFFFLPLSHHTTRLSSLQLFNNLTLHPRRFPLLTSKALRRSQSDRYCRQNAEASIP